MSLISKLAKDSKRVLSEAGNDKDRTNEPSNEVSIDVKNEQLILGHVLNNKNLIDVFLHHCEPDDFLIDHHKVIAWCIRKMSDDVVTVSLDLFDIYKNKCHYKSKNYGGFDYVLKLSKTFYDDIEKSSYVEHLKKLKSDSVKSNILQNYVKDLMKMVHDPRSDLKQISDLGSSFETYFKGVVDNRRGVQNMVDVNKRHDEEINRRVLDKNFLSTGFRDLDEILTDGFASGKVTVVAGRPSMGKSAFVANSISRMANHFRNPIGSVLFAMEMDSVAMVDRLNSIESDIPLTKLIKDRNDLSDIELDIESRVKSRREKKPIYICDDVRKTIYDIKNDIKKLIDQDPRVKVCFIDLFMKIQKTKNLQGKSTADQYTELLNECQRIARELNVHMVLVVQIGRKVESRDDKRPNMSDLKDSGGYEEIADNIFLFYRDIYYVKKDLTDKFSEDIMEIIVAKQRGGNCGVVKCKYIGSNTKIKTATQMDIKKFEDDMVKYQSVETDSKKDKKTKKEFSA